MPGKQDAADKTINTAFIGFWALLGGRAELGEVVKQTVVREVKVETGLDVRVLHKVGEYREKGTQGGQEYDYYPTCFLVERVGGDIRIQEDEISEVRLFSLEDLPEVMAFVHLQTIMDFIAQRNAEKTFLHKKRNQGREYLPKNDGRIAFS